MSDIKIKKQVMDAFEFRHACKIFDADRKISEEDFSFIMETARLSPSSFGFEPWSFIVLQDKRIREMLVPFCWGAIKQLPTSSHYVVILARKNYFMKYNSDYINHIMTDIKKIPDDIKGKKKVKYKKFIERDFEIDDDRLMFEWACRQCYIALSNMMTAAAMIGIDSCPIEGFEIKGVEEILSKECDLDTSKYGVACMVSFGYRIKEPREKTRQDLDDIVRTV